MTSLAGRVVAVTGGARGIGLATSRALLAQGARVAIGDVDATALDRASRQFGGVAAYPLDVTDAASVAAFVATLERDLGPLDVLVNNAGVLVGGPIVHEPDEATRHMLDVNLLGVINGTKCALRSMLPRHTGQIVNLASISGEAYSGGEATYCASKHGIVGFTDAIRFELHGSGVRFTLILPGLIDTELTAGAGPLRLMRHRLPPEVAARAIVGAIRRPRRRVYVPASLGVAMRVRRFVPAPVSEAIAARLGARTLHLGAAR